MSLFRRKKSTSRLKGGTGSDSIPRSASLSKLPSSSPHTSPPTVHVDDFGRPIDRPAFSSQPHTPQLGGGGQGSFANGSPRTGGGGGGEGGGGGDQMLLYGYGPIATGLELGIARVEDIVSRCAVEIRQRGLDTPLIMSSMALDISLDEICSLIRSYLDDARTWEHDLQLAAPLSIGAFVKWGLARLVNDQGGRGFVSWDLYREFKQAEKTRGYNPKSCTMHLVARLPFSSGRLLISLLSLFSSIAAHSATNGMPPRKLAALFSPYVFGLPDDQTFDATYDEWQRATDATEHILLAYIRDQQADAPLPTFLERFIVGYPAILNISYDGAGPRVPDGARTEEVMRVRRLTRFHSRNLIASAGTWDVPHAASWQLFFNPNQPPSPGKPTSSGSLPAYTSTYRHLLNIRSTSGLDDEFEDESEMGRYRTRVDKEWSKFGELGFSDVDSKKLEFDLTESERAPVNVRRETMDWTTFESSGFAGRELFAPKDLVFQQSLNQRVNTWPSAARTIDDRLRATEKLLPSFPYDTTAHEEPRITIDALFFEAWADVLVGGGWARDELKESSFALIQWKSRPRVGEIASSRSRTRSSGIGTNGGDPRTEDRWVLVEEFVPREYREALTDPKVKKPPKRISFLRTVRRKNTPAPSPRPDAATLLTPSSSPSLRSGGIGSNPSPPRNNLRPIDESVFNAQNDHTTKLSLSNSHLERQSYAPSSLGPPTSYAPSVISTVRANDGHAAMSALSLEESAVQDRDDRFRTSSTTPPVPSHNVYGSLPSPVEGNGLRPPKRGFLARLGSMRNREKSRNEVEPKSPRTPTETTSSCETGSPGTPPSRTGASPVWADALPNKPPILGAVIESPLPPPPPPKEAYDDSRAVSMVGSAAPRASADDDDVDEMGGQVMFRGSRSYENGLSEVAESVQNGGSHATTPLANGGEPSPTEELLENDPRTAHSDRYLSGATNYSSRVANIVGLYEQRDRTSGEGSGDVPASPRG
ncbi:hypothetical protein JCM10212_006503 [Sporobolomyces blumeae]